MKFGKSDAKINREAPDRASEADLLNIINEARTMVQSGKKTKERWHETVKFLYEKEMICRGNHYERVEQVIR